MTQNDKPVASLFGVAGMDEEQLQLGTSDKFWKLITERRAQKTISRTELERRLDNRSMQQPLTNNGVAPTIAESKAGYEAEGE